MMNWNSTKRKSHIVFSLMLLGASGVLFFVLNKGDQTIPPDSPPRAQEKQVEKRSVNIEHQVANPKEVELEKPTSRIIVSGKTQALLDEISSVGVGLSGHSLRQKQLDFVGELSQRLSAKEKIELCKSIHLSVSDQILHSCWGILLGGSILDENFNFEELFTDMPGGQLGRDMLGVAAASMSILEFELNDNQFSKLKETLDKETFSQFAENYFRAFAKRNPDKALDLLESQMSGLGNDVISRMIFSFESPEAFSKISESRIIQSNIENHNLESIQLFVSAWANAASISASNWISTLTDPSIKTVAAESLVSRWAQSDLNGAAKWLGNQGVEGMDPAVVALVKHLSRYTPDEARLWAERIQDVELKRKTLESIKID